MGPKRIFSNAIYFLPVPASGLRDLKVYIPDTVLRGHNIQFNCTFTLEDEKLFAIKWYRGNYEIFRYMPSSPAVPKKTFPLDGYNVSVSLNCFLKDYKRCEKMKAILRQHVAAQVFPTKTFLDTKLQICQFAVERSRPEKVLLRIYYTRECKETTIQRSVDATTAAHTLATPANGRKIYVQKLFFWTFSQQY